MYLHMYQQQAWVYSTSVVLRTYVFTGKFKSIGECNTCKYVCVLDIVKIMLTLRSELLPMACCHPSDHPSAQHDLMSWLHFHYVMHVPCVITQSFLGLNGKPSYVRTCSGCTVHNVGDSTCPWANKKVFYVAIYVHVVPVCTLSACLSMGCVCLIWEPTFTNKGGHHSLVCIHTHTESCCSQQLWLRTYIWLYVCERGREIHLISCFSMLRPAVIGGVWGEMFHHFIVEWRIELVWWASYCSLQCRKHVWMHQVCGMCVRMY